MNDLTPENREPISDLTTDDATLHLELHELRQRLSALEATLPQPQQTVRKGRRVTRKMLALFVAVAVLAAATIVFGQNAVDSLFVSKEGNVGIGTISPTNKLSVAGNADISGTLFAANALRADGQSFLFANGSTDGSNNVVLRKDGNKAHLFPWGTGTATNTLSIGEVGRTNLQVSGDLYAGGTLNATNALRADGQSFLFANGSSDGSSNVVLRKDGSNAYIFPWGTGTTSNRVAIGGAIPTDLHVTGKLISTGTYQRDNNPPTTYMITPRYHMSLTAGAYDGSTKLIPQDLINDLCGDSDGCEFRLGMTRWDNNTQTETASRTGLFYYSSSDGHWRASTDAVGVDGNRITEHVSSTWDTCYFTDAPYAKRNGLRDDEHGMYLLVWTGTSNPGRTCELTLID